MWSHGHPPNWDRILQAFPFANRRVVFFAYDGTIYSPSGVPPTPDIVAHERVHFHQQGDDPAGWWERYIADPKFRLEQEVEAYTAQLAFARQAYGRDVRRKLERNIVAALSSPLYGPMASPSEARRLLAA